MEWGFFGLVEEVKCQLANDGKKAKVERALNEI
jgi:hypothetical protein